MAYLGLISSEQSSGDKQRKGPIAKTGNSHVRKALIASAQAYRFLWLLPCFRQGVISSLCLLGLSVIKNTDNDVTEIIHFCFRCVRLFFQLTGEICHVNEE